MQRLTDWAPLAKNIYGVTAAVLGLLLWCWALLDWGGYCGFVFSLSWLRAWE